MRMITDLQSLPEGVRVLTRRSAAASSAMGGTVLFQDALAQRLGLMAPSRQQLDAFLADHPPRISRGIDLPHWNIRKIKVTVMQCMYRTLISP